MGNNLNAWELLGKDEKASERTHKLLWEDEFQKLLEAFDVNKNVPEKAYGICVLSCWEPNHSV